MVWRRRLSGRGRSVGFFLAVVVLAGVVATCDGGGELVEPDPLVPTTIEVTPDTVALEALGDTAVLAARVLDQHGAVIAGAVVSWSSGDPSVATVSAAGVVTAAGNGTAVVTARAGGASAQARVMVRQRIASVVVGRDSVTFDALGDTASLAAEVLDANGAAVAGAAVSWASEDESVATVNAAGLVTTVGNGAAAVTASVGGFADQVHVVVQQRVASVVVGPDSLIFDALGDSASLTAEPLDSKGAAVSGTAVSWASSDESVAAVSAEGVVTAVSNGAAAATASAEGVAGEARVVVQQRAASVIVGPSSLSFDALGDTASLDAEALDANGAVLAGASVSWSSADESVAAVSADGVVTAAGNGTAAVTASVDEAEGQASVEVAQRVASVVVVPSSLSFDALGDTASLDAEALDANGAPVSGAVVSWSSADESVAAVSGTGIVTAIGNGTVAVIASAGDATGETRVVVQQRVASVVVTPDPLTFDALGDSALLVAEARDANGALVSGADLSWSSADESVATVSDTGVATAVGNGTAAVTASADGVSGQAQVVVAQRIASVVVVPNLLTLDAPGDTASLFAEARDPNGAVVSGAAASWSSADESVAAVSADGLVTAVGRGTTVVTASAGDATGQAQVIVGHRIASVAVTPDPLRLEAPGDTASLVAEARDPDGAVVAGAFVSWSSADASVARVNAAGLVTAVSRGAAVITARAGDVTGQAQVVVGRRVASVVVTPASLSFGEEGDTASLVARARDANGAVISGLIVSWSSGDDSVATVSNTGLVTAVGDGTTTVTASVEGRAGSASVLVNTTPHPDRAALVALYNATNGTSWRRKNNWLSNAPLDEWQGVRTNTDGSVTALILASNKLAGTIPSELASLSGLTTLDLQANDLTGPIPSELDSLTSLETLSFSANNLTGTIPPELGSLSKLKVLQLNGNDLTGSIPPELGSLSNLEELDLANNNRLTGSIPSELGNLSKLRKLYLHSSQHTGSIPADLGDLSKLETLFLYGNDLTGPIPPELGNLSKLKTLVAFDNGFTGSIPPELGRLSNVETLRLFDTDLSGPLPDEITSLSRLTYLWLDTAVCAPEESAFRNWLRTIRTHNLLYCYEPPPPVDESTAYLMQAVPSTNHAVPFIAGNPALLRVFVTANNPDSVGLPPVRATFYANGSVVHTEEIPAQPNNPIPATVEEGDFARTVNAEIPGTVVTPGLEMVVEIDPDGTLGSSVDLVSRIPATGRISMNVRTLDVFELTVIPFLLRSDPDSTLLELTSALDPDHELLQATRNLMPIHEMEVTVHEPVWTSSRDADQLLDEVQAIRALEKGSGYWMGMLRNPTGASGVANISGPENFSKPDPHTIAHEFGHNLSLLHAPCGGAGGPDLAYPYNNGISGVWGWVPGTDSLVSPHTPDIMGYCGPPDWISDYHARRAARHRINSSPPPSSGPVAADQQSLLLWGGAEPDGSVFLHPAFVVDAPPSVPEAGGEYRVVGEAEDGSVLFSASFDMPERADGDGGSGFAFSVPVEPSWAGTLARITLTDGGSSATLDREGGEAAVLLRDLGTGQVRGLLLDVPSNPAAQADLLAPLGAGDLDVQVSRGIPAAGVWQR